MAAPTILLSAGEPSGDRHGAAVARALRERWPDARLFGLGGPRMAAAGVELLADIDRLAVMGFVEVAARLPYFARLLRTVRRELMRRRTTLVLPIDYPGFNTRLARAAHEARIPVLYYIAPQVWAWHRSRTRRLARYADRLAVVLPFEEPLFRAAGADVAFVGHPLLDAPPNETTRAEFCARLALDPDRPILALFPGSRAQELERHLLLFAEAAARVQARRPDVQPVIAAAAGAAPAAYAGVALPRAADARALLEHASAALVKSGTSTLEAALAGVPLVIAYRTHPITFWLARRLVRVQHIGLANLVAGERLAPEYIQDAATPAALSAAVLPLLEDGDARATMLAGLARIRAALTPADRGPPRVAERIVQMAAGLMAGRT